MKTVKVICMQMVLALFLSVPAYSGDISTPGMNTPVPVPSPTPVSDDKDSPGNVTPTNSSVLDSADFIQLLLALMF
jgi:hypothetical protein